MCVLQENFIDYVHEAYQYQLSMTEYEWNETGIPQVEDDNMY